MIEAEVSDGVDELIFVARKALLAYLMSSAVGQKIFDM